MELAEEILHRFIVGGYWLCWGKDELNEIMGDLPRGTRGLNEIRDTYLKNETAELSIMELREKAENGELNGLIVDLMNRLFEFTDVPSDLMKLTGNLPTSH